MKQPYRYVYASANIGDLLISHSERDEKAKADLFVIENDKGDQLASIYISHSIKTANALRLMDSVCESLDYDGN